MAYCFFKKNLFFIKFRISPIIEIPRFFKGRFLKFQNQG